MNVLPVLDEVQDHKKVMISDVDVVRIKKYQRLWQFGMEGADVQKYKWSDHG